MAFDAVYMVGMCEGDFPAPPPQDSLLPYETREIVGSGLVLDSQRTFRIKERRAFVTAQASSEQYVLTYARADSSSQRPRFPSPWFMDALQNLPLLARQPAPLSNPIAWPGGSLGQFEGCRLCPRAPDTIF